MSEPESGARYEILVEGVLDEGWSAWFEGLDVTIEGNRTVLAGRLPDESALHGVLARIRDLGITLISLQRVDPGA